MMATDTRYIGIVQVEEDHVVGYPLPAGQANIYRDRSEQRSRPSLVVAVLDQDGQIVERVSGTFATSERALAMAHARQASREYGLPVSY